MLKIRLVSLLVSDILIHAHCRIYHSILSNLSFSLILSIAVQEKHHFIIQIRLILNCLKPRTEFKLETARSSPHDRRFSFRTDERKSSLFHRFSFSVLFYSSSGPFIVETYSAHICFHGRYRFPAIAICCYYTSITYHSFFYDVRRHKYRGLNEPNRTDIHVACSRHCQRQ